LPERSRVHPERARDDTPGMEIRCRSKETEVRLVVEPWAYEFEIPGGASLILVLEGAPTTEMQVYWYPDGLVVWPPRGTVLRVLSDDEEELERFDTVDIPPVPPGWRAST